MMDYFCPDCGSIDIDVSSNTRYDIECLECGWTGNFDDLDTDEDRDEPDQDDWTPPDVGSHPGAIIREYE
jgi:hypothetical protein